MITVLNTDKRSVGLDFTYGDSSWCACCTLEQAKSQFFRAKIVRDFASDTLYRFRDSGDFDSIKFWSLILETAAELDTCLDEYLEKENSSTDSIP